MAFLERLRFFVRIKVSQDSRILRCQPNQKVWAYAQDGLWSSSRPIDY